MREDLGKLYQDAIKTPTKTDDQAILAISTARKSLQKADGEVTQIRSDIRELARRRGELEGARDRARHRGYDDPLGTFGGGQDMLGASDWRNPERCPAGRRHRPLRDNYRAPFPGASSCWRQSGWRQDLGRDPSPLLTVPRWMRLGPFVPQVEIFLN